MIYKAMGWLRVLGGEWGRRTNNGNWKIEGGSNAYAARHQFMYALWRLIDDTPDAVAFTDLQTGEMARARFQTVIDRLLKYGVAYTNLAGEAVKPLLDSKLQPNQPAFTQEVKAACNILSPDVPHRKS
jgi:hypothetical protein